jgi:glycosyltransferase involved in cell wall biosynthesis
MAVDRISELTILEPISILLPTCNEVAVIESVIEEWLEVLNFLPIGSDLKFEDANSTDGTREILIQYNEKLPNLVKISLRTDRDGFSNAIKRLIQSSSNPWIFVADTDGQYFADDIFEHLKKMAGGTGLDFVKGIKVNRHDGFLRKMFSTLINKLIAFVIKVPDLDFNSSHYLISQKLVSDLDHNQWFFRYSVNIEIALRAVLSNANYGVVYVRHSKRRHGISRGNPPHKFVQYGFQTIKDIHQLRKSL